MILAVLILAMAVAYWSGSWGSALWLGAVLATAKFLAVGPW